MGRDRRYDSNADRQRAYRQRKVEEQAWLQQQLQQRTSRAAVSAKLVKVLGMLGSAHVGERDNAARTATQILKQAGLTWYDVLNVAEPAKKK
jgi:hypothetical protein